MPAISFSLFKEKLLSGEKCQTIRKPRKKPLKVGDVLHMFWKMRTKECEKLGITKITRIERKPLGKLTLKQIQKDGFEDYAHFDVVFCHEIHPNVSMKDEFDIITFEPLNREERRVSDSPTHTCKGRNAQ